jgi:hypothetical protein
MLIMHFLVIIGSGLIMLTGKKVFSYTSQHWNRIPAEACPYMFLSEQAMIEDVQEAQ